MINNLINSYSDVMDNVNSLLKQNAAYLGIDINSIFETGGDIDGDNIPAPAIVFYLEPLDNKSANVPGCIDFYLHFDILFSAEKSSTALRLCYEVMEKLNKIIPAAFDYKPKPNPITHKETNSNIGLVTLSFLGVLKVIK